MLNIYICECVCLHQKNVANVQPHILYHKGRRVWLKICLVCFTHRVSLTYRVKSAHKVKLTDKQLLQWMVPILLVMLIYLSTWTLSATPSAEVVCNHFMCTKHVSILLFSALKMLCHLLRTPDLNLFVLYSVSNLFLFLFRFLLFFLSCRLSIRTV